MFDNSAILRGLWDKVVCNVKRGVENDGICRDTAQVPVVALPARGHGFEEILAGWDPIVPTWKLATSSAVSLP